MKTYGSEPGAPTPQQVQVGISEFVVTDADTTLKSYGLGSCLGVALYDPEAQVGGLAHVMLPSGDEAGDATNPGKFADTAIRAMLRRMVEEGATYTDVEAKIAGGSDMFEFKSFGEGVGNRNVEAARAELEKLGVPLVAEDVGGEKGRTVEFNATTGVLRITVADGEVDGEGVTEL
ncbi:chemotaxis protein [Salinarchaeum sp. Harcht-Bsk1]|uniref:chemotaxis protein CheD n=1 Tax=Salinarchaeum sp. Harcht-Bsk1 TaxID=1333523 RepID=UPI0003424372|nr:chemotaxis protein CheD [Salinarchaeum sp. Harcht-Bsk1]AGN00001.1 chemotaxis protein [Salinarchaeum sp. Harcht-Bsk1]